VARQWRNKSGDRSSFLEKTNRNEYPLNYEVGKVRPTGKTGLFFGSLQRKEITKIFWEQIPVKYSGQEFQRAKLCGQDGGFSESPLSTMDSLWIVASTLK
jgi:hypothetical protein